MTFQYRYRKQIIIGVCIFLLLASLTTFFILNRPKKKKEETKTSILLEKKKKPTESTEEEEDFIKVDIKGEILVPGIYSLEKESRVIDVITLAGGLTDQADTSVINLSKKIQDEMVIIIYSREEVANFKKTKEVEKQVIATCVQKEENALQNDACIGEQNQVQGKISINNATVKEFTKLSGIGESKAKEIVKYREEHGPFQKLEDLKNVPGIGENLFASIQEDITL